MELLFSIILLGSIYSLLGAGFVIIYKASRLLNFAYPALVLLFGYFSSFVVWPMIGNPFFSVIVVLLCAFVFGILIYFSLLRSGTGESVLSLIIITVALGIFFRAVAVWIWEGKMGFLELGTMTYHDFPGGLRISNPEIITILVVVVCFILIGIMYRFSKIGRQMRATSENMLLSAQRRINIYRIVAIAWGLGCSCTSLAAILMGANYMVGPPMEHMAMVAFAVAIVGGLDSLFGTILAAFILSGTTRLAYAFVDPKLGDALPYMIMLIVLIIKPWGLFGTEEEIERV